MTLVVEDGNGLPTANTWVAVAYADAYFSLRGVAAWGIATNENKEAALVRSCDYIETVWSTKFLGSKAFASANDEAIDQALSFPRDTREAWIGSANYADVQYIYPSNAFVVQPLVKPVQIPVNLKKAQCEYALRALVAGLLKDPIVDNTGAMITGKTTTVGPVTTSVQYYATGGIQVTRPYPAADLLLQSLVRSGGQVIRG